MDWIADQHYTCNDQKTFFQLVNLQWHVHNFDLICFPLFIFLFYKLTLLHTVCKNSNLSCQIDYKIQSSQFCFNVIETELSLYMTRVVNSVSRLLQLCWILYILSYDCTVMIVGNKESKEFFFC